MNTAAHSAASNQQLTDPNSSRQWAEAHQSPEPAAKGAS